MRLAVRLIRPTLERLWHDEQGQAITEYILLISLTTVSAAAIARAILAALDRGILKLGGQLERDLRTGRGNLRLFEN